MPSMYTRRGKVFELLNRGNSKLISYFINIVTHFNSPGPYDNPVG